MGRQGNRENTQSWSQGLNGPEKLMCYHLKGHVWFLQSFWAEKKPNSACRTDNWNVTHNRGGHIHGLVIASLLMKNVPVPHLGCSYLPYSNSKSLMSVINWFLSLESLQCLRGTSSHSLWDTLFLRCPSPSRKGYPGAWLGLRLRLPRLFFQAIESQAACPSPMAFFISITR